MQVPIKQQLMKFKLCGVLYEASFLTVAVMSAVIILDTSGRVMKCFLCAIIHECGHLLAMKCFSIKPESIKLSLFDVAINADTQRDFLSDLIITLSGPLMNFLTAIVFYFCSQQTLFIASIVIGTFNLLPVETFDGGHALLLLLTKKLSLSKAHTVLRALTFALLLPIFALGILVLFYSKYNYSLLLIALYLLAVLFLK